MPRGRPCLGWEVLTGQSKTKKQDRLLAGGRPETDHGALGPGLGLADPHSCGRGIVRRKRKRPRPLRPLPFAFHSVVVGDPRSRSGNSPRVSHSRGRPQTRGRGVGVRGEGRQ